MSVAQITEVAVPSRRLDSEEAIGKADLATLGGRISFARLRQKLTQAEVAKTLEKSRATVVQYEQNNIQPPIDVVEDLAKILNVSPSFLAYGENTVPGLLKSNIEMISFGERRPGKDGSSVASAYAMSRDVINHMGVAPEQIEAFVLNHDAREFGLKSGDRLFIDKSIKEPTDKSLYLLKTTQGVEIVRIEPNLTNKGNVLQMTGPSGQPLSAKLSDLDFIGAVVGTLRKE